MANDNTYFITAQTVVDNSVINENVDTKLVEPFILMAQNLHIERIVGTGIFRELVTQVAAATVSADNATLLNDYIRPALLPWVVYEALPFLNYKITNKSVSKKDSDNSTPSDLSEVQYLRKVVRDVAEYMSQRMTAYLLEQSQQGKYPLYKQPGTGRDVIRPSSSNYFSGLYLGNGRSPLSEGRNDGNIDLN